jgi:Tfp pilus assembly protein PilN|tara:strand:- start:430 stop:744 length:315 start_codon:yes stop_codon:yes gene_type:complete
VKLSQEAGVSFSLSFLIQLVTGIVLAVWAYSQLDGRISALQNSSSAYDEAIGRIEETMRSSQDAPISSDHVQNTSLVFIEKKLEQQQREIDLLEARVYEMGAVP